MQSKSPQHHSVANTPNKSKKASEKRYYTPCSCSCSCCRSNHFAGRERDYKTVASLLLHRRRCTHHHQLLMLLLISQPIRGFFIFLSREWQRCKGQEQENKRVEISSRQRRVDYHHHLQKKKVDKEEEEGELPLLNSLSLSASLHPLLS